MQPPVLDRRASTRPPYVVVGLTILSAGMTGCGKQESITTYSVPKEAQTPVAARTEEPASRPMAWFFKLEGPPDVVAEIEPAFRGVVESVRFEADEPVWTLPEGWSQSPGSQMRFATLTVDGTDPALEVTVIPLPVFGDDPGEYMRQNIDRWRRQIGLEPTSGADWLTTLRDAGEMSESQAGGVPVTFIKLSGTTEKFDPARMLGAILIPDAPTSNPQATPRADANPSPRPESSSSALTFETPEGWDSGKASSMRAASFAVTDGEKSLDISAMTAGGDELANVNRWRGQIGLENITSDTLEESVEELEVDGHTGRLFNLVGEEQTIVAVIVPIAGQSWFFKMMGDPALADRELEKFKAFVTSVKFP